MRTLSDCIATLGSRHNLIFDPACGRCFLDTFGAHDECPVDLAIGLTAGGVTKCLPLTRRFPHFGTVDQRGAMTQVTFVGTDLEHGLFLTARFRAPFYPRDIKLSTAPFFYVTIEVRKHEHGSLRWTRPSDTADRGTVFLDLAGDGLTVARSGDGLDVTWESVPHTRKRPELGEAGSSLAPIPVRNRLVALTDGVEPVQEGFRFSYDVRDPQRRAFTLVWAGYDPEPRLELRGGRRARFKYCEYFGSMEDVVTYAREDREATEVRCSFLDATVQSATLGANVADMAAYATHSLLLNSYWCVEAGTDWFSVMEGSCYYHSTIDVEYNQYPFYLALWPELLGMLLRQWPEYTRPGRDVLGAGAGASRFFCHDMGSGVQADDQHYHHAMPVEENCNYLLLLYGYAAATGDLDIVREHHELLCQAVDFILRCDTTGNGFADHGNANTVDDASPAVQYGREQVYLAVKALAAVRGLIELCEKAGLAAPACGPWLEAVVSTLDSEAWLGDHYAVTLTRTTEGLVDAWSGDPLPEGELSGWDAYSIYSGNGLLIPLITGLDLGVDLARFRLDIVRANDETMAEYGGTHSSIGKPVVWFSQNMWRDAVAGYLGVDIMANIERYWSYQVMQGGSEKLSCFYDTTMQNNLCTYPRGVAVFSYYLAASGLTVNRLDGTAAAGAPLRSTLRVPLFPLGDWEAMDVPFLDTFGGDGTGPV